jgi:hypothetical protein
MIRFRLHWEFSNGHKWHNDYATMDELESHLLSMGLYDHPSITSIKIEEIKEAS